MLNARLIVWGVTMSLISIVTLSCWLYVEQLRRSVAEQQLEQTSQVLLTQRELNRAQRDKIKEFDQLGIEHQNALRKAQHEIDILGDELNRANQRLYINADCPTNRVPDTQPSGSVEYEGAARLSRTTEQDYLRLRRMMVKNYRQTKYLQDYIKTQCLAY